MCVCVSREERIKASFERHDVNWRKWYWDKILVIYVIAVMTWCVSHSSIHATFTFVYFLPCSMRACSRRSQGTRYFSREWKAPSLSVIVNCARKFVCLRERCALSFNVAAAFSFFIFSAHRKTLRENDTWPLLIPFVRLVEDKLLVGTIHFKFEVAFNRNSVILVWLKVIAS